MNHLKKITMKKFTYFAAIAAFAGVLFMSCSTTNEPVKVTGVSLNKTTLSLVVGTNGQLTATVAPNDAADKSVSWTSSDNSIATVADGNITAVSVGEATITVTTKDGGKTATCAVTVVANAISAESITLDKTEHTLFVGDDFTLTATVLPANSTDNVEWQTSNAAVATVADGVVTAVSVGEATITAKAGNKTATCLVTVTEPIDPSTIDDGVIINGVKWATRNIAAPGHFADTPESAGMFYQWNRKIGWSSTDPMINSNGGTTWDNTTPAGTEWETANDPSPAGWRVPTLAEIETLLNTANVSSEWTTQNGVNGRLFTDLQNGNTLFLPAAGDRGYLSGNLSDANRHSDYWSSTQDVIYSDYAYCFGVSDWIEEPVSRHRRSGYSVRPVAAE
jgi:uncharacterized protein (TIGR02145 family)